LQVRNHREEVLGPWVPGLTEHPHQTLGLRLCDLAKPLKANGRVDEVAQNRLAGLDITL
jgi:hypothetical protein